MSESAPLRETDYMRFQDDPNPGGSTRIVVVYSRAQGSLLGRISWFGRWRQYAFTPASGTVFNNGCLTDLADRISYLNVMHAETRKREAMR